MKTDLVFKIAPAQPLKVGAKITFLAKIKAFFSFKKHKHIGNDDSFKETLLIDEILEVEDGKN